MSLHGHPRLLDTAAGCIVADWSEVRVLAKPTCFGGRRVPTPVAALHSDGTRLALAQPASIALIRLP
ncbi:hypothetical protein ACIBW9_08195 [Streptomyces sp. NPDC049541]|uniref:hypothetical protein n=1 Tax=Streptomyces sp. NPDC049541 TaxID=3365594 RepID=UPI00379D144C